MVVFLHPLLTRILILSRRRRSKEGCWNHALDGYQ
jgi:hypothetical protein